ncbi:MAG: hypothetical protein CMN01_05725 [Rickettsiales bacterium]|nr:hypothetical protein [Rickettsiales bacterium]|tara:strand:+ start:4876 stop:5520 length:645 start_codon:yes stop_codon:yes gene_type:complete
MSEEFIREVDEDLKQEKNEQLWKKLLPYIISITVGIIIFTSGYVFWDNYSNNVKQQLGDDFTAAVELANEEDLDAALLALDRIVDKGSDGYVTLSKMKKASLLIESGNLEDGLDIYLDLEQNAVDQSFRDISTILFVLNSIDTKNSDLLLQKLIPLEKSKIWKSSALELMAFIYLKKSDNVKAIEIFRTLSQLQDTPSSLANRSQNMLDFLEGK